MNTNEFAEMMQNLPPESRKSWEAAAAQHSLRVMAVLSTLTGIPAVYLLGRARALWLLVPMLVLWVVAWAGRQGLKMARAAWPNSPDPKTSAKAVWISETCIILISGYALWTWFTL